MKRNLTITKVLIAMIGLTFTLTSCSTWHYNNPRVSVDREKNIEVNTTKNSPVGIYPAVQHNLKESKVELNNIDNTYINYSSSKETPIIKGNNNKTTSLANVKTEKKESIFKLFAEHVKSLNKKPCKIEHAEKTAASGWVRIMIIFFVVGLILLLVGIFLSVFLFGPFWWLFYALGGLLILAGFVILILVLLGLI